MATSSDTRTSHRPEERDEALPEVSVDELADLVTDCGVLVVHNPALAEELTKRGFVVSEEGAEDGKRNNNNNIVLRKAECEPAESDLKRLQSLVVDAYAPYSPKHKLRPHPFAADMVQHAKIAAPQQIIMQSPSEPEFIRAAKDLVTHETAEQEVYADVRFRAAYSRLAGSPQLQVHLMIEEVQFGVAQASNTPDTRGHFVYALEIKAFPSEKWAQHATQTLAKPSAAYNLQRHATLSVTERLSNLAHQTRNQENSQENNNTNKPDLSENNNATTTTTTTDPQHRWLPAVYDPNSAEKSVEWAWKMSTWADGQPFDEANPSECYASDWAIPELPFPDPEVVRFKDLEDVNEAAWELPKAVVTGLRGRLDWRFEVKVFTALLRQKKVRVGEDGVLYRRKAERVVGKFKGKTSRSDALIVPLPL